MPKRSSCCIVMSTTIGRCCSGSWSTIPPGCTDLRREVFDSSHGRPNAVHARDRSDRKDRRPAGGRRGAAGRCGHPAGGGAGGRFLAKARHHQSLCRPQPRRRLQDQFGRLVALPSRELRGRAARRGAPQHAGGRQPERHELRLQQCAAGILDRARDRHAIDRAGRGLAPSGGCVSESAKLNSIGRVASLTNITFTWSTAKVKHHRGSDQVGRPDRLHRRCLAARALSAGDEQPPRHQVQDHHRLRRFQRYAAGGRARRGRGQHGVVGHLDRRRGRIGSRDKLVNILAQYGSYRHPQLPDACPPRSNWRAPPRQRQILALVASSAEVGYSIASTPNTPADRIQMLRVGFDAMDRSREFLDDIAAIGGEPFDPMPGDKLQNLIRETLERSRRRCASRRSWPPAENSALTAGLDVAPVAATAEPRSPASA